MVKDTVFSPSFGNRPSYFVGRETLMDRLIAGLENASGSRDRAIVLLGQRGKREDRSSVGVGRPRGE